MVMAYVVKKVVHPSATHSLPPSLPPSLTAVNISFAETQLTVREGEGIVRFRILKADDTSVPGGRGIVRIMLTTVDGSAIGAPFGRWWGGGGGGGCASSANLFIWAYKNVYKFVRS